MDTTYAELIKSIDPAVLGRRIRVARVAAGLTQTEAAGGDVSTGYLSRIETGERRPDLKLLHNLATRLYTSVDELLTGLTRDRRAELRLELDYAELELSSGKGAEALRRAEEILAALPDEAVVTEIERPARLTRAYALETTGDLDAAIVAFEELTAVPPRDLAWVRALIALSRCYRESGDFGMAIDVGERAATTIEEQGLSGLTEALQLTLTVAAAYFERGDTTHAVRLCKQTIDRAAEYGSATARGSAYWNASMMAARQGSVREALGMARQAIALFEQDSDTRNLARLRTELANMQLRQDPPEAEEAKRTLEQAARELDWSSASTVDKANNQLALARATLLLGDATAAAELADSSYHIALDQAPLSTAEALVVQGQIAAIQGRTDLARTTYREAIGVLSGVGADRRVAELWFELGGLLQDVGEVAAALDAYRRSASSTGIAPAVPLHQAMARTSAGTGRALRSVPVT
jgi:tetratricopeptide (TPR) repeat protein